ncbi:hypothetical protein PCAU_0020 [Pseudomonas chlororaphis subsp. aurantiaca]|nr:hypothetical protein PCAU_0020 [Pseudomonas chlororaphis subsp. aurantiaca]
MRSGRREARKPCSRCRAREAAIGCAATAKPESAIHLEKRVAWLGDCYAVDRRLRQRLQEPRRLCSRCRAREAAIGCAATAKPESAIHLEKRVAWLGDCYAIDRRLRQRLQGVFYLRAFTTFHMERLGRPAWPVLIFGSFTHSRATTRTGFREDDHTFNNGSIGSNNE